MSGNIYPPTGDGAVRNGHEGNKRLSGPDAWRRLGWRAAITAGAYVTAALVVVLTFLALKGRVEPRVLQALLGYFFIASLSAGLEPGTIKAAALSGPGVAVDLGAALAASIIKGLAASPILALVWRFADPHIDGAVLAWTPGLCVAGFAATDLRVLFDLEGRHATAIWVKQGALAAGLAIVAALAWLRVPLAVGVAVSTLARLAFVAAIGAALVARRKTRIGTPSAPLAPRLAGLFADRRWMELAGASLVAAISGSTDRVFGLRYLSAEAWAGYYLLYEVFSKFWFLPYLLGPIVFARRLADGPGSRFGRAAGRLIGAVGLLFVAAVVGAIALAPRLPIAGLHLVLGAPTVAFAAAVVTASFTQVRIAQLQGAGASRRVLAAMSLGAALAAALFFVGARQFGVTGLMVAWLIKAAVELGTVTLAARVSPRVA